MTLTELRLLIQNRPLYRFTGTPENWLTGLKFGTWGFKERVVNGWEKLNSGDIFLMHSQRSDNYPKAEPRIIGFGILGEGKRRKESLLWQDEFEENKNKYPYLAPIAEVHLFSDVGDFAEWDSDDRISTQEFIQKLLEKGRRLPKRLVKQGSLSIIKNREIVLSLLKNDGSLHQIERVSDLKFIGSTAIPSLEESTEKEKSRRSSQFTELTEVELFKEFKKRTSRYERDNVLSERANREHQLLVRAAKTILLKKEYKTYKSRADIIAENVEEILLFEAKSIPEGRFQDQARKAIAQLLEYEYFDGADFQRDHGTSKPVKKILLIPRDPKDKEYIKFLLSIGIHTVIPNGDDFLEL